VSKRTVTRWYIGAWLVWVVALVAVIALSRSSGGTAPAPALTFAYLAMVAAGLVTVVMWIAALLKLARQRAIFSFITILLLQLVGLGIVGMVAYAVAGPDEARGYVIRPSVT
jgi:hypothetical protein